MNINEQGSPLKTTIMTEKYPKNLLFLDFDGVMNSFECGSYMTSTVDLYGVDPEILKKIRKYCEETHSKIVISSNWRRFPKDGVWSFNNKPFKNPLPKLIDKIGDLVFGYLTKERHLNKANAIILWFENNPDFRGGYVIFDDDLNEQIQSTHDFHICDHFIHTNIEFGVTDDDLMKAKNIVNHNFLLSAIRASTTSS